MQNSQSLFWRLTLVCLKTWIPPGGSNAYKAQTYSLNQRKTLEAFLLDGRLELTSNIAERAVNPVVLGRKNCLFADTPRGADASTRCYSIIETARKNGLDIYGHFLHLLTELPKLGENPPPEQLSPLTPWSSSLPDFCRKGSLLQTNDLIPS